MPTGTVPSALSIAALARDGARIFIPFRSSSLRIGFLAVWMWPRAVAWNTRGWVSLYSSFIHLPWNSVSAWLVATASPATKGSSNTSVSGKRPGE